MFKKKLLLLALCIVLGGAGTKASPFGRWSVHGVVVNKTFRTTPLSHSLGVDGIYKLEVRDEQNKVRRQMVTRELFLAYEFGDQFEPNGAPPTIAERTQHRAIIAANEKLKERAELKTAKLKTRTRLRTVKVKARSRLKAAKVNSRAELREVVKETLRKPKGKLIVAAFPQEMLPETEGF